MSYTPEQIKARYNRLPADVKQAMDSVDTTNAVVDIGQKYDLMYDQISELVDEVGLTMIGLTPENRFVTNIARRMQVDMGKAMLIAQDINKEIFDRMRDSLRKIEGGDTEGYSDESSDVVPEKPQPGEGEETMTTDAEKAHKSSVVDAVGRAGGFVIETDQAPLQAEEMVRNAIKEKLESKKDIINVLERNQSAPPPPDHLLDTSAQKTGDVSETIQKIPAQESSSKEGQQPDQTNIVDMLLSKGVAVSMGSDMPKPEKKIKPYDGTDPYREPLK